MPFGFPAVGRGLDKGDTSAGMSVGIFGDTLPPALHPQRLMQNPQDGILRIFEWDNGVLFASTTPQYGWDPYMDTGGTLEGVATDALSDDALGILRATFDGTDEDAILMQYYGGLAGGMMRTASRANGGRSWYLGGRFRVSSIADDGLAICFGAAQGGANTGTNSLQADATGALADIDFIGFQTLSADGDSIDAIHRVSGTAVAQAGDGIGTISATTAWFKLELAYNAEDQKMHWYVDGKRVLTVKGATITGATWPDQQELAPAVGYKATSATAFTVDNDWIAFAVERFAV